MAVWLVVVMHMYCSLGERVPIGRAPYKPVRGAGRLSCVSEFNNERAPMYVYSDSLPSNLLKHWVNNALEAQVLTARNRL